MREFVLVLFWLALLFTPLVVAEENYTGPALPLNQSSPVISTYPPVSTVTFNLKPGWNLISNPVMPGITNVTTTGATNTSLSATNVTRSNTCGTEIQVWVPNFFHDNLTVQASFLLSLNNLQPGQSLVLENAPLSYWIKVPRGCRITLRGSPAFLTLSGYSSDTPFDTTKGAPVYEINGYPGWGVVQSLYSDRNVKWREIMGDCNVQAGPFRYDSARRRYVFAQTLSPGVGYFVKMWNSPRTRPSNLKLLCNLRKVEFYSR